MQILCALMGLHHGASPRAVKQCPLGMSSTHSAGLCSAALVSVLDIMLGTEKNSSQQHAWEKSMPACLHGVSTLD